MRLTELNKPKQISNFQKDIENYGPEKSPRPISHRRKGTPWNQIVSSFKMHGFEKLGYGNWGAVFKNPQYPYVIKVFLKDSGFTEWVQYAIANQHNPHVPSIKGKITKIKGTEFYFVRIGELSEFSYNLFADWDHYNSFMSYLDEYMESGDEDSYDLMRKIAIQNKIPIFDAYFKQALDFIRSRNSNGELIHDLHGSNLMANGKIPVITDPLFHRDES